MSPDGVLINISHKKHIEQYHLLQRDDAGVAIRHILWVGKAIHLILGIGSALKAVHRERRIQWHLTFLLFLFQLFSIIVFGCIASQGYWDEKCQYNDDPNACGFGTTIGVLAFLGCMALLVLDALFDNISSIQQRKYIVIGDIVFSGKTFNTPANA